MVVAGYLLLRSQQGSGWGGRFLSY
ncbi:hypothetical protein [Desulforamulus reducens]|nr:hypothetical protein [Desulforamulus reducens]